MNPFRKFASIMRLWWQLPRMYVIADPSDDSITLSKRLFKHIRAHATNPDHPPVAFMFELSKHPWLPDANTFGFCVNPDPELKLPQSALCPIQHNNRFRCIGFQSTDPNVSRILYHFGLSATHTARIPVFYYRPLRTYILIPPQ